MRLKLNWALFILSAASTVFYPVWRLPLPWPAQLAMLNFFIVLSAAVLYTPLDEVSAGLPRAEFAAIWPAVLAAALVCLPFWLTPIPVGSDDQSHAGPPAWILGRLATAAGLDIRLLPFITIPAVLIAAAGLRRAAAGLRLPDKGAAALTLLALGNLYFLADLRFGIAGAIGRFETVLRYPPLAKFLYLSAYALLGVNEAAPRLVQFGFMALAAVYIIRLLKVLKAAPYPLITALTVLFFPTFFNLAISAELEAGTVLFFAAAIFHFISAVDTGERGHFLKCAFWTAAGFFYKQLLLGLLLSCFGALAALWLLAPGRRGEWLFALKAMAIPAALGLPFIAVSALLGVRTTGFNLANLLSPGMMLVNLADVYRTTGPLVTVLLTVSAAAAWKRRGTALYLLIYFAAAYYVMISGSNAAGYIRHAQPFYIALTAMLALGFSGLAAALPARFTPFLAAALLAPLLYQAVLARAPYQRKTAANYYADAFPYREAMAYLKGLDRPGLKIYAPMEVEPSHFYLARAGLAGKVDWNRTLPAGFTAGSAAAEFARGGYDYLLLPRSPFSGVAVDFTAISGTLLASGGFAEAAAFDYHGNRLVLIEARRAGKKI